MAFALTLVWLDFFLLLLNRDPNAVTLDDGWGLGKMTTAEQGILLQVNPKPLKFLQHTKPTHHLMMTTLTLQHGNGQLLDMSPCCLERWAVMPVSGELSGILTVTLSTWPVNFTRLLTHQVWTSFFSSQFGRYLRFEKGRDDLLGGL
jgi:hypothetical protein